MQFAYFVPERLVRPDRVLLSERNDDPAAEVANEVRQFNPHAPLDVAGSAVFSRSSLVPPPRVLQQRSERFGVAGPHRKVDIAVSSRDRAGVEVDCPATKEPALEATPIEKRPDLGQCGQLLRRNDSCAPVRRLHSVHAEEARAAATVHNSALT